MTRHQAPHHDPVSGPAVLAVTGHPTAAELAAVIVAIETVNRAQASTPPDLARGKLWGRAAPPGWVAAGRAALAGQAHPSR